MELLVLEGDGIGPEITAATIQVVQRAAERFGFPVTFRTAEIGFAAMKTAGTTFPMTVLDAARAVDGVILGPVSHNDYAESMPNPSGMLRKHLDLFANIRPARTRPGLPPRCGIPLDLVTVRENTEGFYADRTMFMGTGEFMPTPDLAMAMRKVTRHGSTRIAEAAFRLARTRRKFVTAVHKFNVLRISDGLFLECVREVASRYPDVTLEEQLVDSMTALLIRDPSKYDVIVTTNMFGDILSDEAAELSGSLGLAASLNASDSHAVAQAQHGSAPSIAGEGVANPASLIGSAAMLLAWLGERSGDQAPIDAAAAIEAAMDAVVADPAGRTRDLGGSLGTQGFTDAVVAALAA
jgi:3-isopropylmalate dehydrogenase